MKYLVTLAAFVALLPLPAFAQIAPPTTVRCAVSSLTPDTQVTIGVAIPDGVTARDEAAAICWNLIASGEWQATPADVWPDNSAAIGAAWVSPISVLGVWSAGDQASATLAYSILAQMSFDGYPVDYY